MHIVVNYINAISFCTAFKRIILIKDKSVKLFYQFCLSVYLRDNTKYYIWCLRNTIFNRIFCFKQNVYILYFFPIFSSIQILIVHLVLLRIDYRSNSVLTQNYRDIVWNCYERFYVITPLRQRIFRGFPQSFNSA